MTTNNAGIYVHVPFCKSRCIYCDFVTEEDNGATQKEYVQVLMSEIVKASLSCSDNLTVDSIYFGGGTPSILSEGAISAIMERLCEAFCISTDSEITIECNPESITRSKLQEYKSAGVNRISMGLQCSDDTILREMGRKHSAEQYKHAVSMVNKYFDNYSVDLILGLPDRKFSHNRLYKNGIDIVRDSIDFCVQFEPKHISVYALKVEQGTLLHLNLDEYNLVDDDEMADLYQYAVARLQQHQYNRYEISNFCRNGYESRHNLKYWLMGDYYGFGVAASGRHGDVMTINTSSMQEYLTGVQHTKEKIELKQQIQDCIMLALRLTAGLDTAQLLHRYGCDILSDKRDVIDKMVGQGLIQIIGNNIVISPQYFFVSNAITAQLVY